MIKCTNANRGTYGHECGKPAEYVARRPSGYWTYYCDHCRQHGDEARKCDSFTSVNDKVPPQFEKWWTDYLERHCSDDAVKYYFGKYCTPSDEPCSKIGEALYAITGYEHFCRDL